MQGCPVIEMSGMVRKVSEDKSSSGAQKVERDFTCRLVTETTTLCLGQHQRRFRFRFSAQCLLQKFCEDYLCIEPS